MKTRFDSILKIERNKLDEYINDINIVKVELENLEHQKIKIEYDYKMNTHSSMLDNFSIMQFQNYSNFVKNQLSNLQEKIDQLNKIIEEKQDIIAEQFANVKKIEIIIKNKKLEIKKKVDKKEQNMLDEIKNIKKLNEILMD